MLDGHGDTAKAVKAWTAPGERSVDDLLSTFSALHGAFGHDRQEVLHIQGSDRTFSTALGRCTSDCWTPFRSLIPRALMVLMGELILMNDVAFPWMRVLVV